MFAITGTDVVPIEYRILNIAEDEPHIFSFDLLRYERHKFLWIEQGIKFEPDPISRWIGPLGAPTNLVATSVLYTAKDGVAARLELSWSPSDDPRIRFYEVEVLEPGLTVWRRDALTVSVSVVLSSQALGVYGLRVRATAEFMEPSPWTTITYSYGGLSDPPPDVGSIWASQMNDMLYLEWTPVLVLDLSHYEIRAVGQDEQPVWERANQLLTTIPAKTVAAALPLVPGVYLIKAVDFGGAFSRNAAFTRVTSDLTLDMLYDTVTDVAPFNGLALGTRQSGNDLILARTPTGRFVDSGS
jgi:predicted phage tail protein